MSGRRRKNSSLPFLALPYYVLNSHAFRTLSPQATKLLLAVGAAFRGGNNGELEMPFGELTRDWHYNSRTTISRAISELLETNLLVRTRKGRGYGNAAPSLYALGWHPIPASDLHSVREISARLTPQVLSASPPSGPIRQISVHPVDRQGSKPPFSSKPENEVMRGSSVHCDSASVHQVDYLSISMPYRDGLCARSLLDAVESIPDALIARGCSLVTSRKNGPACVPVGGAKITPAQLAYFAAKPKPWPAAGTPEYSALVAKYCYFEIPLRERAAA